MKTLRLTLFSRLSLPLLGALAGTTLCIPAALAQIQLGAIQGTLRNQANNKPLAGVTVVISGPAMQGDQTEVTDSNGKYLITQIPPGDNYIVRFYFNDVVVERPGVRLAQNKTLNISASIPTSRGTVDKIVLKERAPNVDTVNANTGVEVTREILQNTAVRGRTYESAMSLAPGSSDTAPRGQAGGDVGVSFSGSTGNENALLIDGLNTTDLNTGVLATQLHQFFIKDIQVITGGYQAEYGRATGGVVSVTTETGSNEYHGGVFASWSPYQATPITVARLGEALGARTRQFQQYDFGFSLGGPIVKDRLWFYLGFAPTFTTTRIQRVIRNRVRGADGKPERDPDYAPPSYLANDDFKAGLDQLALRTTEADTQDLDETERLYNWIAKLQFNINPDHNLSLGYIGAPRFERLYTLGVRVDPNAGLLDRSQQIHDLMARYTGKFFDRKLQVEVLYGFHHQGRSDTPFSINQQLTRYRGPGSDPYSLADFENLPSCRRDGDFNPCPITDYTRGGSGQYVGYRTLQRHMLTASATLFLKALGTHGIKLGFDFEDNNSDNTRRYTGTDFDANNPYAGRVTWQTNGSGRGIRLNRGFAMPTETNTFGDKGVKCAAVPGFYCYDYFRAITESRYYALYLRDQWNVSFLPGLVINAGVRWEIQDVFGANGEKQIGLYDNIAPRIGATWDPTKVGRSKIYANYGRFYESIPMDINDRSFSGEGLIVGDDYVSTCPRRSLVEGGRPVVVPAAGGPGAPCGLDVPRVGGSGVYAPVAPGLKGQFLDEVVVGGQYDIGWDVVVGAFFTYRTLGNAIEDLSVDGGNTYFIANPGQAPDPELVKKLDSDLEAARAEAKRFTDASGKITNKDVADKLDLLERGREVYTATVTFPKAKRNYYAGTLTLQKRLSNRFSVLANYTYSRLLGNYPGPYSPFNNQLDPNISTQFDIIDLTVNRDGPLTNDRPHNIKATGFYQQPLFGNKGQLVASLTFTAISGRPIYALGQHAVYGLREVFVLPGGSAGRTPMVTQTDVHVGYDHQLTDQVKLSVFVDVINLFNQREVTNVDDEYTFSIVDPINHGKPEDLKRLRATDGSKILLNPNYAQPTAFQAPLYFRLGGRLSF